MRFLSERAPWLEGERRLLVCALHMQRKLRSGEKKRVRYKREAHMIAFESATSLSSRSLLPENHDLAMNI
jgi:hypothetical protein